MGLTIIHLPEKDILDIDDSFGTFDYIIVHGIWSWVPDVVKDKTYRSVIRIYPTMGVAYVSYNTYPDETIRAVSEIMQYAEQKELGATADGADFIYEEYIEALVADTMGLDNRSVKSEL